MSKPAPAKKAKPADTAKALRELKAEVKRLRGMVISPLGNKQKTADAQEWMRETWNRHLRPVWQDMQGSSLYQWRDHLTAERAHTAQVWRTLRHNATHPRSQRKVPAIRWHHEMVRRLLDWLTAEGIIATHEQQLERQQRKTLRERAAQERAAAKARKGSDSPAE